MCVFGFEWFINLKRLELMMYVPRARASYINVYACMLFIFFCSSFLFYNNISIYRSNFFFIFCLNPLGPGKKVKHYWILCVCCKNKCSRHIYSFWSFLLLLLWHLLIYMIDGILYIDQILHPLLSYTINDCHHS